MQASAAPANDYVEVNANGTAAVTAAPTSTAPGGLPAKPQWAADEAKKDDDKEKAAKAMTGGNKSIVQNRMALRMANLSAAEMMKAQLAAGDDAAAAAPAAEEVDDPEMKQEQEAEEAGRAEAARNADAAAKLKAELLASSEGDADATSPRGTKRSADVDAAEMQDAADADPENDEDEDEATVNAFLESSLTAPEPAMVAGLNIREPPPLKLMGNNVVEQDDTVKCVLAFPSRCHRLVAYSPAHHRLWEPGYKERYYRSKFGVELSDVEFRKK